MVLKKTTGTCMPEIRSSYLEDVRRLNNVAKHYPSSPLVTFANYTRSGGVDDYAAAQPTKLLRLSGSLGDAIFYASSEGMQTPIFPE